MRLKTWPSRLLLLSACCLLLAACGQKGDLFLPETTQTSTTYINQIG